MKLTIEVILQAAADPGMVIPGCAKTGRELLADFAMSKRVGPMEMTVRWWSDCAIIDLEPALQSNGTYAGCAFAFSVNPEFTVLDTYNKVERDFRRARQIAASFATKSSKPKAAVQN